MKDYKRLTPNSYTETIGKAQHDYVFNKAILTQAWDWENKIESGELCEREELIEHLMTAKDTSTLIDKEIEFFIKHNEKVRKETAREILKPLYNVIMEHSDCCVNLSEDIKFLMEKYGVDLEDEK